MASLIFNIAKGALVEKFRDGAANGIVLLMEQMESDAVLADYDNLSTLLAAPGNTEFAGGGYSRQTGITGAVVVDDVNDRAEVTIPDQTWSSVTGNPIVGVIVAYEESPSDAGRVPLTKHDWAITPDGSDITARFP